MSLNKIPMVQFSPTHPGKQSHFGFPFTSTLQFPPFWQGVGLQTPIVMNRIKLRLAIQMFKMNYPHIIDKNESWGTYYVHKYLRKILAHSCIATYHHYQPHNYLHLGMDSVDMGYHTRNWSLPKRLNSNQKNFINTTYYCIHGNDSCS